MWKWIKLHGTFTVYNENVGKKNVQKNNKLETMCKYGAIRK